MAGNRIDSAPKLVAVERSPNRKLSEMKQTRRPVTAQDQLCRSKKLSYYLAHRGGSLQSRDQRAT
jgi:hypothetical protein